MRPDEIAARINPSEFRFSATRSSGPGGQNVNKVNTKIELRFNIPASASLTDEEKDRILSLQGNRITADGDLLISSQSERTQLRNKEKAKEKLFLIIARTLTIKPERKATRPTAGSKEKRVEEKKKRSTLKKLRKISGGLD